MKVLFTLHDEFDPHAGGMGVTAGLTEVYERLGHEVDCFSFADMPSALPLPAKALFFPEYVAWRRRRPAVDVIDAACGDAWLWARLRRMRGGEGEGPLLATRSHGIVHIADIARREEARRGGIELSWKYPLYWGGFRPWEVAGSFRLADLSLFLNKEEREFAVERLGVAPERAHVVDNGLPSFLLGLPPPGSNDEATEIVHLGSYLPLKGTRYLVEALSQVMERDPRVRASFLGTSCPVEQVLGDFAPQLRARVEVKPKYRREELPQILRGRSIAVSASLKEGFGLGVIEAMACGLAPVCADAAGPLQYLRDGENGLVIPRADSAALAAALERLIADPTLLARLRAGAHETAQRYSWDRVAAETLALYEDARERRRAGYSP